MALSGQTATTKAMGEGSTQSQHLVQTEVPPKVLAGWLAQWAEHNGITGPLGVSLRPHTAGSELLELSVLGPEGDKLANIIFAHAPGPARPRDPVGARPEHLRHRRCDASG